jgi:hypothetical protein
LHVAAAGPEERQIAGPSDLPGLDGMSQITQVLFSAQG